MEEKIYINGISLKEFKFASGDVVINAGINVDALIKQLEELKSKANDKGYINTKIVKRKEVSQYGHTHYMQLDTWQPKEQSPTNEPIKDNSDGLPF